LNNLKQTRQEKRQKSKKTGEKISEFGNEIEINKKEYAELLNNLKLEIPLDDMSHVKINNIILDTQSKVNEKTNLIREIEKREGQLKELGKIFEIQRDNQVRFLQKLQKADVTKVNIEKEIRRLLKEKESISDEVEVDKENVLTKIKIFGIKSIEIDEIGNILEALKQKQDVFQKNQKKRDVLEKEVTSMNSGLANSKARIKEIKERVKGNQASLNQLSEEFNQLNKERKHLFADKEPDMEEKSLDEKVDAFEKNYEKAKQENEKIKHELNSAVTKI